MLRRLVEVVVEPGKGTIRPSMSSLSTWLSITDREVEGEWRDAYTGEVVEEGGWVEGEPGGGEGEDCALLVVPWQGWVDWPCVVPR